MDENYLKDKLEPQKVGICSSFLYQDVIKVPIPLFNHIGERTKLRKLRR
jgi:hypothetical protein